MFTINHYDMLIYIPDQNFNFSMPSLCNFDLMWQILIWSYLITILLKSLFSCLNFSNFAVQNYALKSFLWFCQRVVLLSAATWNKPKLNFKCWYARKQNGSFHNNWFQVKNETLKTEISVKLITKPSYAHEEKSVKLYFVYRLPNWYCILLIQKNRLLCGISAISLLAVVNTIKLW